MCNLYEQAEQLQLEPVLDYIRSHYKDPYQESILLWIVNNVRDEGFIASIYDALEQMGSEIYEDPTSRIRLFDEPLSFALAGGRYEVAAKICETAFTWSISLFERTHWLFVACRSRNMAIVEAYIKKRGIDFMEDPSAMKIIVAEDNTALVRFCLERMPDRNLLYDCYELAISDEMRKLLCPDTGPITLW